LVYQTVSLPQEIPVLSINSTHPQAKDLFKDAGVPISRADLPIVTFYRHNLLINEAELKMAFDHVEPTFNTSNVAPQAGDWYPLWLEGIQGSMALASTDAGKLGEPNIIVLNTGPHWTTVQIGSEELTEADFKLAFQKTVSLFRLASLAGVRQLT
jgi:hypothetical protein